MVDGVVLASTVPVPYRTIKYSWPQTAGHNIQIGLSNARSDSQREATWKNEYVCEVYRGMHAGRYCGFESQVMS